MGTPFFETDASEQGPDSRVTDLGLMERSFAEGSPPSPVLRHRERDLQSSRSAVSGSTRVARTAGTQQATTDTIVRRTTTAPKVQRSPGSTPNSMPRRKRAT